MLCISKKKENLELIETARNFIEEREFLKAEEIGETLVSEGRVEGYFILTDIAHANNEIKRCISILESGILEHEKNWVLWMRLGNYQSDLEKYEDAEYSFDRALFMDGTNQSVVKLNKAILLRRLKRFDEAIKLSKECTEEYPVNSFCFELDVLNELEKYEEIISKADAPISDDYEEDFETTSRALFYIAKAFYKLENIQNAELFLKGSLDLDRSNENSLWLRRVLFGKVDSTNKYFQIMINGDYKDEETSEDKIEFFTWYDVIAKDIETALEEIKQFEPLKLDKNSFRIEEHEIIDESTLDPSGIYRTTGFSLCEKE